MANAGRCRIAQSASVIIPAAAARCAGYVILCGIGQYGQLFFDLHLEASGPESMSKKTLDPNADKPKLKIED